MQRTTPSCFPQVCGRSIWAECSADVPILKVERSAPAAPAGVVMSCMLDRRLSFLFMLFSRMKYFCAWLATCVQQLDAYSTSGLAQCRRLGDGGFTIAPCYIVSSAPLSHACASRSDLNTRRMRVVTHTGTCFATEHRPLCC